MKLHGISFLRILPNIVSPPGRAVEAFSTSSDIFNLGSEVLAKWHVLVRKSHLDKLQVCIRVTNIGNFRTAENIRKLNDKLSRGNDLIKIKLPRRLPRRRLLQLTLQDSELNVRLEQRFLTCDKWKAFMDGTQKKIYLYIKKIFVIIINIKC